MLPGRWKWAIYRCLKTGYGSRELSFIGLACSAAGLYGLAHLKPGTSLIEVLVWKVVMGIGSGFFISPNINATMGAVASERRGIASGIRTMMNNSGTALSLALGMTMIGTSMSRATLSNLVIGTQVGTRGIAVSQFMTGLHHIFWVSFAVSVVAAVVALMRGKYQAPDGQLQDTSPKA